MRLSEIADHLFRIPPVDWGTVQQYEVFDKHEARPMPGAGGEWEYGHRRATCFRVVIATAGGFADIERPSLRLAITDALEAAGLSLDDERTKAEAQRLAMLQRRPSALDDRERAAQSLEFKKAAAALQHTVAQLDEFAAWLSPIPAEAPAEAAPVTRP